MEIIKLTQIHDAHTKEQLIDQVKNIFYLSSSIQNFSTVERKEAFFKRWCGDYISLYPNDFYIIHDKLKVYGYLSGTRDSSESLDVLEVPALAVFSDLFEKYPAHLHINFHPDARGKGLGSLLVNHYKETLREAHIKGLHLVTSPGAKNISFYERLGFNHQVTRNFNQSELLFMGTLLD